ncbi:MAG: methyltransferase domain-containing protein [Thermodesulfobacteriota bacterium]|nr:methyltransferase domain-containing protein [Thermodesulfobacteriota bacterium]
MKLSRSHKIDLRPDERIDYFMEGRLKLIQSKNGYRFSIDAVLLSEFVVVNPGDLVVDLGTGCGVVLLILLLTKPVGHVFGLEIQEELAAQASRNAILNGFEDRMEVILGDIKHLPLTEQSADVVVCNPPYRKMKSGRTNPDPRRAIARHEVLASIDDILGAARRLLRRKGRLILIYPSVRLVDMLVRMRYFGLEPKTIQVNYPGLRSYGKLVLIEALSGGRPGVRISPPIFGQGNFSILAPP